MNKGIIIFGIIAIVAIASVAFLASSPDTENEEVEVLDKTPKDNYSEIDRDKFCGTGDAKSTKYVNEYLIPTECTQPLAIVTSPDGNVWFAQSNAGKLAKFDPLTESFTEFDNRFWPRGDNSMIWGLDYASDDTLWFTDDKHNSIWKFDIETKEYERLPFAFSDQALPQRILVDGSRIIVNDFTGNQIVYFDNINSLEDLVTYSLPSNAPDSVVADFTLDSQKNLWYTNWILGTGGILGKLNQTSFDQSIQTEDERVEFFMYDLPLDLKTPNGITHDDYGNIWLADSSTSLFFKYDIESGNFTKYVTPDSSPLIYGNLTGQTQSVESQPYWIDRISGKIAFNEQAANRIAVFDPSDEYLLEYKIPSQNPNWGDCENKQNCGISQVFDFTIDDNKIWFTEWAENKIGVIDTSISPPLEIQVNPERISLLPGESKNIDLIVTPTSEDEIETLILLKSADSEGNLILSGSQYNIQVDSDPVNIGVTISASETAPSGEYKVLVGSETPDMIISQFVTVVIE